MFQPVTLKDSQAWLMPLGALGTLIGLKAFEVPLLVAGPVLGTVAGLIPTVAEMEKDPQSKSSVQYVVETTIPASASAIFGEMLGLWMDSPFLASAFAGLGAYVGYFETADIGSGPNLKRPFFWAWSVTFWVLSYLLYSKGVQPQGIY